MMTYLPKQILTRSCLQLQSILCSKAKILTTTLEIVLNETKPQLIQNKNPNFKLKSLKEKPIINPRDLPPHIKLSKEPFKITGDFATELVERLHNLNLSNKLGKVKNLY